MRISLFLTLVFQLVLAQDHIFEVHPYGRLGTDKNLTASTSLGDLDGDGDMDIVVANGRHWSEQNRVFFNDTATTEIYTILFVGSVRCV